MASAGSGALVRSYWALAKGHWSSYAVGTAAHLTVNALDLVPPALLGLLIDSASGHSGRWSPAVLSAAYVAVFVLQGAFRYPLRMGFLGSAARITARLREEYATRVLRIPESLLSSHSVGDLMTRATADLGAAEGALSSGWPFLFDCIFYLLFLPAVLVWLDPVLGLGLLVLLPLIPAAVGALVSRISEATRRTQESYGRLVSRIHQGALAIETVRSFGLERREEAVVDRADREYAQEDLRRVRLEAALAGAVQGVIALSLASVLFFGGMRVLAGRQSLGRFVSFMQYTGMLAWPLMGFAWAFLLLRKGGVGLARVREVLDLDGSEPGRRAWLEVGRGALEVRALTFAYPGSLVPALSDVSFSLEPGERVAVVGPLGSGKSTLLHLLGRLIEPPPGTVSIDGVDASTVDFGDWRTRVGLVPQNPFLFSGTVRENIAMGSVDPAGISAAAERARIGGEEFGRGLETPVGAKGDGLSGGQRQRVTVARALAAGPTVLLLDDATSSLDPATEAELFVGLGTVTVLFSTHRMALARRADRILVLDGGRVVEAGTAEELLAAGGMFSRMARTQEFQDATAFP